MQWSVRKFKSTRHFPIEFFLDVPLKPGSLFTHTNSLEACHYIYDLCQLPRDQQWNKWQLNLDRSQVDIIPHKEDVEDFF